MASYLFSAALAVGGTMGYVKTGSLPSLLMGISSALVLCGHSRRRRRPAARASLTRLHPRSVGLEMLYVAGKHRSGRGLVVRPGPASARLALPALGSHPAPPSAQTLTKLARNAAVLQAVLALALAGFMGARAYAAGKAMPAGAVAALSSAAALGYALRAAAANGK